MAAKTALKEHAKSRKDGRISNSIEEEEVQTVTDLELGGVLKMLDTIRGFYDPNLVIKKGRKKYQLRIVGSDREL